MPDVASATGGEGGRRARKPPVEHPGEVTKQKQTANNDNDSPAEGPPLHKGPKIGGATNFLSQTTPFIAPDNHTDDDVNLKRVAQLQPYATSTNVPDPTNTLRGQSLEAYPGWRRHWPSLTEDQLSRLRQLESVPTADEGRRTAQSYLQSIGKSHLELYVTINEVRQRDFQRIRQALQLQTYTPIRDSDRPFWENLMHEKRFY